MSRPTPSTRHHLTRQLTHDGANAAPSTSYFDDRPRSKRHNDKYRHDEFSKVKCNNINFDTGISEDDSCTDVSYYNYYYHQYGKPFSSDHHANGGMFSDNSDFSQVPDYEYNKIPSSNRCSRNFSQKSFRQPDNFQRNDSYNVAPSLRKDSKRVYPKEESTLMIQAAVSSLSTPYQIRPVERPQSTISSEVTSVIVDGCGGHCQTFENVFYYFLQVAFAMGILIGMSLCIAGAVLRKSAARNLQVLVYIGAMLSLVSSLLLAIQCNARCNARKRKKDLRQRRSVAIPLETLQSNPHANLDYNQQALLGSSSSRTGAANIVQMQNTRTQVHGANAALTDGHGIPWWRREDLQ